MLLGVQRLTGHAMLLNSGQHVSCHLADDRAPRSLPAFSPLFTWYSTFFSRRMKGTMEAMLTAVPRLSTAAVPKLRKELAHSHSHSSRPRRKLFPRPLPRCAIAIRRLTDILKGDGHRSRKAKRKGKGRKGCGGVRVV